MQKVSGKWLFARILRGETLKMAGGETKSHEKILIRSLCDGGQPDEQKMCSVLSAIHGKHMHKHLVPNVRVLPVQGAIGELHSAVN